MATAFQLRKGFIMEKQATISPEDLHEWLDQKDGPALIHTLPEYHYTQAHLPGARLACVYEVIFLDLVAALAPEKTSPIVVYGASRKTMDAHVAADKLARAGYSDVRILEGGMNAWTAAGYALEGQAPQLPPTTPAIGKLDEGLYHVDTEESLIEWAGRNPNSKHDGSIPLSNAQYYKPQPGR